MKFAEKRRARILSIVQEYDAIEVARLASQLDVSKMTIRRDLAVLQQQGLLHRVRGGAVTKRQRSLDPLLERETINVAAKAKIADLAMELVADARNLFIGGSSTLTFLARLLVDVPDINITTNSMRIAQILAEARKPDVTLIGGALMPNAQVLIGGETIELLQRRFFDLAFAGIAGIDLDNGFLESNEWHVAHHHVMRQRAKKFVVLADHTKLGTPADFCALPHNEVDVLVTDRKPDAAYTACLADSGITLVHP